MDKRASRLSEYCQDRIGEGLRAVGYHSDGDVDVAYLREDLESKYPPEKVEQFITSSRSIHGTLQLLDSNMGGAEASLHMLEEGLIIQFHFPGEDVIFLSMDRDVGRNFTSFIRNCLDVMT